MFFVTVSPHLEVCFREVIKYTIENSCMKMSIICHFGIRIILNRLFLRSRRHGKSSENQVEVYLFESDFYAYEGESLCVGCLLTLPGRE